MTSFQIQVIVLTEEGEKDVREITLLTRGELAPETLGLSLAEGKTILKDLQQIVVAQQVGSFLASQKRCPDCNRRRHSKGYCDLSVRTLFGKVSLPSERVHHCDC